MVDDTGERSEPGRGVWSESLRKALATGVSALFMTEEGIRSALSEMRLPKEAMSYLIQQAASSRRDLVRFVSEEVRGVLQGIDLRRELRKALVGLKLEVKAEIRIVEDQAEPAAPPTEPPATSRARRRRAP